jgi:hypothetical protein
VLKKLIPKPKEEIKPFIHAPITSQQLTKLSYNDILTDPQIKSIILSKIKRKIPLFREKKPYPVKSEEPTKIVSRRKKTKIIINNNNNIIDPEVENEKLLNVGNGNIIINNYYNIINHMTNVNLPNYMAEDKVISNEFSLIMKKTNRGRKPTKIPIDKPQPEIKGKLI